MESNNTPTSTSVREADIEQQKADTILLLLSRLAEFENEAAEGTTNNLTLPVALENKIIQGLLSFQPR